MCSMENLVMEIVWGKVSVCEDFSAMVVNFRFWRRCNIFCCLEDRVPSSLSGVFCHHYSGCSVCFKATMRYLYYFSIVTKVIQFMLHIGHLFFTFAIGFTCV